MSGTYRWCARVLMLAAALTVFLIAPGGSAFAQDADATISMHSLSFLPTEVHIPAGGTVLWINESPLAHTVTADDLSWDSGSVDAGDEYTMSFDTPGTYGYYCIPHGSPGHGMAATIIVDDPGDAP